ncbi:MAG: nucleotidyltransferase family protein [Oscillospiraceae bacterium]|nr:nucleotidyltransferase family protein [Oscillospiraceae bacterium]
MSVIGIVCEFNPFHNGHKYLIDSVKKDGDIIVAVMSGNFVQRGEPALFPKEYRIKSALECGADIVLELPFIYATASAEIFAEVAVTILDAFGCEKIAFGAENADIEAVKTTANILSNDVFSASVAKKLKTGISYPAARQAAFLEYGVNFDISAPNNILGVEYVKAINKMKSEIIPVAVKRLGAGYNDMEATDGFASASYLRKLIFENCDFSEFVPSTVGKIYADALKNGSYVSFEKYNTAMLSVLRQNVYSDLSHIANMAEGLENRIKSAVKKNITVQAIYDTAKTKRFTHSRIRRTVLAACFGITAEDLKISVPYCRLTGFRTEKNDELGLLASKCKIPFAVRSSDIKNIGSFDVDRVFEFENKSTDFYNLILHNSQISASEMTFSPIKMK